MSSEGYKGRLFNSYYETHSVTDGLGANNRNQETVDWVNKYYDCYLKRVFDKIGKNSSILEIGCNQGYYLQTIYERGQYDSITGIDLSPGDLCIAKDVCDPRIDLVQADAFEFLKKRGGYYDLIFSKAVFEHIDKNRLFELLELCKYALKDGGLLVIEVPNMDWIFSNHERYMDFTHECGFTKESLGQVMRECFGNVDIMYNDNNDRHCGIKTKIARKILFSLMYWSEPVITKDSLFSRCIMAVSQKELC